ncbi:MAG: hypothetical protein NTW49_03135 [Bacteroidia bacterium]|nr:hypothetical protein [Bacteroidia bacterium]
MNNRLKKTIIIICLLVHYLTGYSQDFSNLRTRNFLLINDSIKIDTLSIIPGSVKVFMNDHRLADSSFFIDYANALLVFRDNFQRNSNSVAVKIQYRVFPFSFTQPFSHKPQRLIIDQNGYTGNPYRLTYKPDTGKDYFSRDRLNKSGSLSRGITFGNNQDLGLNSGLNLQLSGRLNSEFEIEAAVTDNNIPIQPDGTSQQINEFDKVFIRVFNDKTEIIAGDFDVSLQDDYFLKVNKKVKGGMFSNTWKTGKENPVIFKSTISGSVSKGKYQNIVINGIEGNQGPYHLTGADGESYVIILAGSERVFIDGKLMKRGLENDYTIDYNTAELVFTPSQPITKDKRITVEFEYSDQSYTRFMVYNTNTLKCSRGIFRLNIYSEQDSKNQPLQQNLTDSEKKLLAGIGDSLNKAVVPNVDSVAFRNDLVLYKKIDSLVNRHHYAPVYVYSTNPDSARFQVGFSFVGSNKGNYIQVQSLANGRVFKWVAPGAGQLPAGNYEPVTLLITPKKKQMITLGGNVKLGRNTRADIETAISNNDLNTFSATDKKDDVGYAARFMLTQRILAGDTNNLKITANAGYHYISRDFSPVENFRSIEFNRDWNIKTIQNKQFEHSAEFGLNVTKLNTGNLSWHTDILNREAVNTGLKNTLVAIASGNGFRLDVNGSLLTTSDTLNRTVFLRHKATISQILGPVLAGAGEEQEINTWKNRKTDSLLTTSASYRLFRLFLSNADTSKSRLMASYSNRRDYQPIRNNLKFNMLAEDFNITAGIMNHKSQTFRTVLTYRQLTVEDTSITKNRKENTLTARIEHNIRLFHSALEFSTFYEVGSGLEQKKEYSYIEVTPGQGIYEWIDYNHDGIKNINEFEVSDFPGSANYIRVFMPSDEYEKVKSVQLNEVININPARIVKQQNSRISFISRLSDQLAYHIERKNIATGFLTDIDPFTASITDSSLKSISGSVKNTFSFNKTSPIYGADMVFQNNRNKMLLTGGFENRVLTSYSLKARWNITKSVLLTTNSETGDKELSSDIYNSKNYHINYFIDELNVGYQQNLSLRINLAYKYSNKKNTTGEGVLNSHDLGSELVYNVLSKSNISVKVNYVIIAFDKNLVSTPLGWEMLNGLKPGNNGMLTINYLQSLPGNLQLTLNYTGRTSEHSRPAHFGGVQLRAAF